MQASEAKILIELKAKRRTFKGQITCFKNPVETHRASGNIFMIKGKIEAIKKIFATYTEAEAKLLGRLEKFDLDEKLDVDDDYSEALLDAMKLVEEMQTQAPAQSATTPPNSAGSRITNLLQIALPTFSGRHEDWLAFAN